MTLKTTFQQLLGSQAVEKAIKKEKESEEGQFALTQLSILLSH